MRLNPLHADVSKGAQPFPVKENYLDHLFGPNKPTSAKSSSETETESTFLVNLLGASMSCSILSPK